MDKAGPEAAREMATSPAAAEDRGASVVAMSAAALSGLVVGLLLRGEFATGLVIALSAALSCWIGWWARGTR